MEISNHNWEKSFNLIHAKLKVCKKTIYFYYYIIIKSIYLIKSKLKLKSFEKIFYVIFNNI